MDGALRAEALEMLNRLQTLERDEREADGSAGPGAVVEPPNVDAGLDAEAPTTGRPTQGRRSS